MFKRRLAVLGTVGVLALAVLGGSALADGTPAPDVTVAVTTAAMSCRTPDGKEIKAVDSVAARVFVARDENGEPKEGAPAPGAEQGLMIEISPLAGTEAAPTAPAAPEAAPSATLPEGEMVRAVPALPATELPPGAVNADDLGKVVHIVCAPAKPAE
ncbi:hypothetical protein [Nonomuraea sp. NPDC052265]|uniref:hypothetical protein n=1 Tax=Nonomuraea sp. NPDC052265 TaxID=3364374 RepID=UPI0037C67513